MSRISSVLLSKVMSKWSICIRNNKGYVASVIVMNKLPDDVVGAGYDVIFFDGDDVNPNPVHLFILQTHDHLHSITMYFTHTYTNQLIKIVKRCVIVSIIRCVVVCIEL